MTAQEIITTLGMQRHPEGGWYAETFRDGDGTGRGASTAIYYLLQAGEKSHWHRVRDAAEVWHYYAGAPLALHRSADGKTSERLVLGIDLAKDVFQVHGVDEHGNVTVKRQLKRKEMIEFFTQQ